jgi:hypothetical protein
MGNSESQHTEGGSRTSGGTAQSEMRTCYYEVLQVERSDSTTTDDIKKVVLPFPVVQQHPSVTIKYVLLKLLYRHIADWRSNITQTKITKIQRPPQKSSFKYKPLTRCCPTSRSERGMTRIENKSSAEQTVQMPLKTRKSSAPLLRISWNISTLPHLRE